MSIWPRGAKGRMRTRILRLISPSRHGRRQRFPGATYPRKNGLGQPLPNFCLKVPTGGGKTLLAVKTIDLVNTIYRKRQTGLVLWIVPTTQIYRQTIQSLKDRDHPYRQHLDLATGGHTVIAEKTDRFSPQDVSENLVVLMLMLPSANRKTKETLKVFKDSGGFQDFFPPEDDIEKQEACLKAVSEPGHLREAKRGTGGVRSRLRSATPSERSRRSSFWTKATRHTVRALRRRCAGSIPASLPSCRQRRFRATCWWRYRAGNCIPRR